MPDLVIPLAHERALLLPAQRVPVGIVCALVVHFRAIRIDLLGVRPDYLLKLRGVHLCVVRRLLRGTALLRSTPSYSAWGPATSCLTGQASEAAKAVGSTSEAAVSLVPTVWVREGVVAAEAGSSSIEPRPSQRSRGGTAQRASRAKNDDACPRSRPPDGKWNL